MVAVWWLRRRGSELRTPPGPRLVKAVTVLPFVVIAVFIIRPYVERNWHALQYAPLSLHWIYWYTGAATIAFAVIATAMLGRRCVKGEAPVWVLPLLTFAWAIVWFLLRPAITPHQPYASRRLVPAVLPGLILLAVWLAAWLGRRSRVVHLVNVPDYLKRSPRVFVIACCAGAIFLPPMIGNFGLGLSAALGRARAATDLRRRDRRDRQDLPGHPAELVGAHRRLHDDGSSARPSGERATCRWRACRPWSPTRTTPRA